MKFVHFACCCLAWLLISSCSKDSAAGVEEDQRRLPDFRLIGEDAASTFQYTYDGTTGSGEAVNLTQTLGVNRSYLTLRQVGAVVSFYSFSSGNFSLYQQNTLTGQSVSFPNFYTVSEERAITWGANAEDQIFLGYYSPRGSRDFGVRFLDPSDGSFTDRVLESDIEQAFDPLYYRQRLLVTYKAGGGAYKIAILNTESGEVLQTLDLGAGIPNVLIDDTGDIGILLGLGNSEFVYRTLAFETLEETTSRTFSLNEFFPAGPFQGSVFGTTLYYVNSYAQPAAVPFGPAYVDIVKGQNFNVDIVGIVQEVEAELGLDIDLTSLRYYEETGVFLLGYAQLNSQFQQEGGVVALSKTGNFIDRLPLPFVPTYFLRP
jgi:hypothetical protein